MISFIPLTELRKSRCPLKNSVAGKLTPYKVSGDQEIEIPAKRVRYCYLDENLIVECDRDDIVIALPELHLRGTVYVKIDGFSGYRHRRRRRKG